MKRTIYILFITLLLSFSLYADSSSTNKPKIALINVDFQIECSNQLRQYLTSTQSVLLKKINNKPFFLRFYRQNSYMPLWINETGINQNQVTTLFSYIKNDITLNPHGPIYEHYQLLEKSMQTIETPLQLAQLEVQLTALYYDFLDYSIYGSISWREFKRKLVELRKYRIYANWIEYKPPYSISELLLQENINDTMDEITPKRFGYQGLLLALQQLKEIEANGGWEKLPTSKTLALGSSGDVVKKLRERLEKSHDLNYCEPKIDELFENNENNSSYNKENQAQIEPDAFFDTCLENAVKHFQKRHGLDEDGVVGGTTQRVLNITIQENIQTILLNIERIKWLPRAMDERYLVVNIPEFMLHYIVNNETQKKLKVIVGDKKHPTPIFNQAVSFMILNPYWKIPEGIVQREIVPAMMKNRNYLRKEGIEAHRTWDEHSAKINLSSIYWGNYRSGRMKFPYRLMQPPGPKNALGKIKFKFPNQFDVYLHDTPTKHLFDKSVRAFSHGCVRLWQPELLLESIASFDSAIDLAQAEEILKGTESIQLNMSQKLPIYLVYLTARMNNDNEIEFSNDIYDYDKKQKLRLR
jgi:murein L,D-transpeptidase YcbB/YkuD